MILSVNFRVHLHSGWCCSFKHGLMNMKYPLASARFLMIELLDVSAACGQALGYQPLPASGRRQGFHVKNK